jgi:hypothetical protein
VDYSSLDANSNCRWSSICLEAEAQAAAVPECQAFHQLRVISLFRMSPTFTTSFKSTWEIEVLQLAVLKLSVDTDFKYLLSGAACWHRIYKIWQGATASLPRAARHIA